MLDAGAICPSKRPFSSNVVLVWKKMEIYVFALILENLTVEQPMMYIPCHASMILSIHLSVLNTFQNDVRSGY